MKCYLCKNYKEIDFGGVVHIFCGLSERENKFKKLVNNVCNKFEKDLNKVCNCDNCENYVIENDNCCFIPSFENGKCTCFCTKDKQISLF